ncbi:glycyl-tRNA synthetase [Elsinoe ampelina]|uniref:glycine--tRNA ligase n=1 Tax=Elsinoe ampelina TaxID=302913 RepID=A0A6A6GKR4_9PEZI|nr:glycyl-tRNA synthetase [Elsinoe ampelina]
MGSITDRSGRQFDRKAFESLLKRRFFFTESYQIYRTAPGWTGDNGGLFDYGPPGTALQNNIVHIWRKHFVLQEDMLELDCSILTPEDVLKTSGHVERFSDWMCKDPVRGQYLRADHLVEQVFSSRLSRDGLDEPTRRDYENVLAQIDNYSGDELGELIEKHDIRNPAGDGSVEPPIPFNLMFKSSIGPSSAAPIYLRPETAQSQFLNFRKLLEYNNNTMPFASASVGKSYRNEISPRSGLLRTREFLMAEIEHFVDPSGSKKHERFSEIEGIELVLLDRESQMTPTRTRTGRPMSVREAVHSRIIDNETLGYFLARTYLFLTKIGVDPKKLRFRQHLANEMAHYASDCWDAELLTTHGWIECVGCADRSAYDLEVHSKRTGEKLVVQERLTEPIEVVQWVVSLNKKLLGQRFRHHTRAVEQAVAALSQAELEASSTGLIADDRLELRIQINDVEEMVVLSSDILTIYKETRTEYMREYTPNVIEPSFGISRILYSLLEHSFWSRAEDSARSVLSLPVAVAPIKVALLPLSNHDSFNPFVKQVAQALRKLSITSRVDGSNTSIGKRYARSDEVGTPYAVTVDFDTVEDSSVTLRERDSTEQVRGPIKDILKVIDDLVAEKCTWDSVRRRLLPL